MRNVITLAQANDAQAETEQPFFWIADQRAKHGNAVIGQVNLPLIGTLIVPSRFGPKYTAGHVFENGHHMFVTTGIGTSIVPIRFRVTPEIVILTINP